MLRRWSRIWVWAAAAMMLAEVAGAQEPAPRKQADQQTTPAASEVEDVQALIERMQKKIERMNRAAAERDSALEYLEKQVEQAAKAIGSTSETAQSLREKTKALSGELQDISKVRDRLTTEVSERERLLAALEQRVAALTDMLGLEKPDRHKLGDSLERLRERLQTTLAERDRLKVALAEAERKGAELERKLGELQKKSRAEVEERDARLAETRKELADREARLRELEQQADLEQQRVAAMNQEIARLNRQLVSLKVLLASVDSKLEEAAARNQRQQIKIADLTVRLNEALAKQVEELKQYRSEFFGRLRKALGDRPDIRIVGDRFVLQAELLFPSGSAQLDPKGEAELEKIARTLKEVAATIPPDIDWVLRVDGHTDKVPLRPDSIYRSNWELSTARALTVVQFLIDHGVPPKRLAAAGFGEYQPIDPGDSEEAYRRNRRIEFKLTER